MAVLDELKRRTKYRNQHIELRNKLIKMVGEEVYKMVTANSEKIDNANIILKNIKADLSRYPNDVGVAVSSGMNASFIYGVNYFNWKQKFNTANDVLKMVNDFVFDLEVSNNELLGMHVDEFKRIKGEMLRLKSSELQIKTQLNSMYGNRR